MNKSKVALNLNHTIYSKHFSQLKTSKEIARYTPTVDTPASQPAEASNYFNKNKMKQQIYYQFVPRVILQEDRCPCFCVSFENDIKIQ